MHLNNNIRVQTAAAEQRQRNSIRVRQLLLLKQHCRSSRTCNVFLLVQKKVSTGHCLIIVFGSSADLQRIKQADNYT